MLKQIRGSDLVDSVRRVAAGQSLLDPAVTARVLERVRKGPELDPALAPLTDQERRVLSLIGEGMTNRQIAETMFLAEKTVKNYVSSLLAKLGLQRRTQAALFAARHTRLPGVAPVRPRPLGRPLQRRRSVQRHPPDQPGPAGSPGLSAAGPTERVGPGQHVRQAVAGGAPRDAAPVVLDDQSATAGSAPTRRRGCDRQRDRRAARPGVPADVGQRLPEHRQQVRAHLVRHRRVQRPAAA